ncbi:uncharacterized protein LOC126792927 isoform X2 [Argentina anserina]|uniref:uncharacterized protein LOC126792927 isoform X2 n=1 Tax=Argentina anserina TaxID=57926 RepID=UPI0021767344|nr:uncharacterized protein LOC126792927 isoform X2 [Potentilla anserina]
MMYARRINCRNQKWMRQLSNSIEQSHVSHASFIRNRLLDSSSLPSVASANSFNGLLVASGSQLRFFSSEGDTNEGKQLPGANFDKEKNRHAILGEQDQKDWLNSRKLTFESKKKELPFLTRREKFKNDFLRRVVPWENITVSWETFPYYIDEPTKNLLMECAAAHLKHNKCTSTYGARLTSSSGRILLQSAPGTELYCERLVRALARDLQVPLLVLDSSVLAPYDFGDDGPTESESDEDDGVEECASESDIDDENDASNEEDWTSSNDAKSDCSDKDEVDLHAKAEAALKKLVPLEQCSKMVSGENNVESEDSKSEAADPTDKSKESKQPLKKGDRVKYVGPTLRIEADNRPLPNGQRGEVFEVSGDQIAVILDINDNPGSDVEKEEKEEDQPANPPVYWIHANHVELVGDTQIEDCYIVAMEALREVLHVKQPLIVYFPDSSQWLSRAAPKSKRKEFVNKVQEIFDRLSGPVVLICGQNISESESKEKEKFTMILPNFGRLAKLPVSLKRLTEGLKATKRSDDDEIYKLFSNVFCIQPPKEEEVLQTFNKQIEEDGKIVMSRSNLNELHKVLEEHQLSCADLLQVDTDGVILTKRKAEKVVGWAKSHYLSSCLVPSIKGDRLQLPRESLEVAISRLKEQENLSRKPSQNLKNLAKDEYESNFVSAVVPPGEIGVRFDDVGALEEVKKALNELVILPMRRPELFSHGNLLRPCKGILLFGPPGTGKTLLAKALATEAGANFISITGSTLTSKWFGDAEKLTKALFSFASKLAPVIIFVDEVDSLLGARGGSFEHEATRRMRNEFMAAWDGLRSKDSQRILILGATNRPFDLDDAVIRRLPRRIYVDLPDVENRKKILSIFLAQENLEPGFPFEKLSEATEGYSGSDLKNLCIAAAYRPVQELLEEEIKDSKKDLSAALRPLSLDDFIQSKAKVGPSVSYDAASMNELRKWNEQYGEGGSRRKSPFGF